MYSPATQSALSVLLRPAVKDNYTVKEKIKPLFLVCLTYLIVSSFPQKHLLYMVNKFGLT